VHPEFPVADRDGGLMVEKTPLLPRILKRLFFLSEENIHSSPSFVNKVK
jgi:hypothetical protein